MGKSRIISNIYFYITLVLVLFPVFPIIGRSVVVGLWALITLIIIIKEKKGKTNKPLFLLLLFSSIFIFYSLSLIYSENINEGITHLFRRLPLIIFPVLFYLHPTFFKRDKIRIILLSFGYVLLAFLSIIIIYLLFTGVVSEIEGSNNPVVFIRHKLEYCTSLHPAYLSLFLGFSFLNFLLRQIEMWRTSNYTYRIFHSTVLVYVFALLLILSSKMSIIAVILISIFILYLKSKSKLRAISFSILILISCILIINVNPTTKMRFGNFFRAITTTTIDNKNPDSIRLGVYKSCISLAQRNLLFGVGLGDEEDELIKQYKSDNQRKAARLRLNTHNQYLEILLSAGIFALIFFVLSLMIPIYISFVHKEYSYFAFLALMSLCLLTENLLSRQAGVMFFAFFNSLFAFNLNDKSHTIFINGRFLTKNITGVQRFATEISRELVIFNKEIEFLTPSVISPILKPLNFKYSILRPCKSHLWEQFTLPIYLLTSGKPLLLNFENTAPAFYKNQISTIHDLSFVKNHKWFSKKYSLFYKLIIPKICQNSLKILTVSKFSKKEIISQYKIDSKKIEVIYNALPNALLDSNPKKAESQYGNYILSVGSFEPRKNLDTLINSFNELDNDIRLLIVGNNNQQIFKSVNILNKSKQNARIEIITGATDEELAALYINAKCFVHIPIYEGFGIPIIEAMNFGCPTIISDIEVFREIYHESALYVDPLNNEEIKQAIVKLVSSEELRNEYITLGYETVKKYSYTYSAERISTLIEEKAY